ncbi:hypothetical protein BANRA_02137 [Escherichia coli]|nr:hypothetical protein BANRA_02137 [Escherichia coli]
MNSFPLEKMINEGLREIDLDEVSSINELKYFMYDVLKKRLKNQVWAIL